MRFATIQRFTDRVRRMVADAPPPVSTPTERMNPRATVQGRLCLQGAPMLRQRLFKLFAARHRQLVLDLSRVRFLDGCALAVLVEFADFETIDLDGTMIVVEEDFPDSIRLPAVAA